MVIDDSSYASKAIIDLYMFNYLLMTHADKQGDI
jgi:hypothetical protein